MAVDGPGPIRVSWSYQKVTGKVNSDQFSGIKQKNISRNKQSATGWGVKKKLHKKAERRYEKASAQGFLLANFYLAVNNNNCITQNKTGHGLESTKARESWI